MRVSSQAAPFWHSLERIRLQERNSRCIIAIPPSAYLPKSFPMSDKPYYEKHVFFCTNHRDEGRPCCADSGSVDAHAYTKARIKEMNLSGQGKIRVNKAGCLDRCEEGPVIVIYPQGTWYTYVDTSDIDEIIESDLKNGKVVDRLKI
jgi:(2Fe-2S) ferredoxin